MPRFVRRPTGLRRSVLAVIPLLLGVLGCDGRSPLERAGVFGLSPPSSWDRTAASRFLVPGTPLAAWTSPDGTSLVVYRALPGPRVDAEILSREAMVRLENLPGLQIVGSSKPKIGEIQVARLDLVAPGTGDAITPSGLGRAIAPEGKTLVPTHRLSLGIPREGDTLWIVWHYPQAAQARVAPEIEAMITGLSIRPNRPASSY